MKAYASKFRGAAASDASACEADAPQSPGRAVFSDIFAAPRLRHIKCFFLLPHHPVARAAPAGGCVVNSRPPDSRMRSAAFSAMASIGRLVLPLITVGIIDPSTTRNLLIPRTRSCASTTSAHIAVFRCRSIRALLCPPCWCRRVGSCAAMIYTTFSGRAPLLRCRTRLCRRTS